MRARRLRAAVARSAVIALVALPATEAAAECGERTLGGRTLRIASDQLVAEAPGEAPLRRQLPVVGSAWRCLAMHAFPAKGLLFVEWHQGSAGTSQIFHRASLLAFSVDAAGVHPRGEWVLRQGLHGDGQSIVEADRRYRLEEREWTVDVVIEGTRRIGVEPGPRPAGEHRECEPDAQREARDE